MDLAPVVQTLQATLAPQLRKQAEEQLSQVRTRGRGSFVEHRLASSLVEQLASSHVSFKSFSTNNATWELDKPVNARVLAQSDRPRTVPSFQERST